MKKVIVVLLLCVGVQSFAQGLFETRVSHQKLGINELLRVDFVSHDDGEKFVAPKFDGFILKEGPVTRSYEETIDGKMKYSFEYSYLLQPIAKGTFKIEPASLVISGENFETNAVKIVVTDAVKLKGQLQNLNPPVNQELLELNEED